MAKGQPEYKYADELIDAVMDYIAQKWTPSMIRRQLREYFEDIKLQTCNYLIKAAKKRIRERYGIDPEEYKGQQIAFYESVIRNKAKLVDKLKAAERLDKLFGLENITNIDPAAIVEKILAFKKQAENTIGGQDDGGSTNGGQGETDPQSGCGENKCRDESQRDNSSIKRPKESATDKGNNKSDKASDKTDEGIRDDGGADISSEPIDENLPTAEEVNEELKLKDEE